MSLFRTVGVISGTSHALAGEATAAKATLLFVG